jgi:myo-inositol-1(or 4)-monophosphatase
MNKDQLEKLCLQVKPLLLEVGSYLRKEYGKVRKEEIEFKSLNSLVSYVDKTAESHLVDGLSQLLPKAAFLTEEDTTENTEGEWRWVIDPLDGTTNFLHQLPFFSISVGLEYQGSYVLGLVYEVMRDECFYAWKDGGAFLNGDPIRVNEHSRLEETLLATGFPYYDYERVQKYMQALQFFMEKTRGIRRFGSAALDLAYVACGRFDAFFEYSLSAWDVAGGIVLVEEAGGKVSDFQGGEKSHDGSELLAASSAIYSPIQRHMAHYFYS